MTHYIINETDLDTIGRHLRALDDAAESIRRKTGAAKVDCEDIEEAVDAVHAVRQTVKQHVQS